MRTLYQKLGYCISFTVSISSDPSFSLHFRRYSVHRLLCRAVRPEPKRTVVEVRLKYRLDADCRFLVRVNSFHFTSCIVLPWRTIQQSQNTLPDTLAAASAIDVCALDNPMLAHSSRISSNNFAMPTTSSAPCTITAALPLTKFT